MGKKTSYSALLRGINVGGNNSIKMVELKTCFESMGFSDVVTYIQSGNVIFKTSNRSLDELTDDIEIALSKKFNAKIRVVVVSSEQLKEAVKGAPRGFGEDPVVF